VILKIIFGNRHKIKRKTITIIYKRG